MKTLTLTDGEWETLKEAVWQQYCRSHDYAERFIDSDRERQDWQNCYSLWKKLGGKGDMKSPYGW